MTFIDNLINQYGLTDKTLKGFCLYLANIPFEKKQDFIQSAINHDGSIMTISFLNKDGIRFTYNYDKNRVSKIVTTNKKGDIELIYSSMPGNPIVSINYIIKLIKTFCDENPQIFS